MLGSAKPKIWKIDFLKAEHDKWCHCDRENSQLSFRLRPSFPRGYVKVRQVIEGMEQQGEAWWESLFSPQLSRSGGVCGKQRASSCAEPHPYPAHPKPRWDQSPWSGKLVKALSGRFESNIHPAYIYWTWKWKKVAACDWFPSQQQKHSGQAIELCCQSLWCKQMSLLQ